MKRCLMIGLLALLLSAGYAHADLDLYLEDLAISAQGDLGGFSAQLGARFGLSRGEVEIYLSNVDRPADAALLLWLEERSHQPRERVLTVYRQERGHGWGALAQSLGIKPGSRDFKALKAGELDFRLDGHGKKGHDKGGKNKEHGKSDKHK